MKLRPHQICPLHRSTVCCGRVKREKVLGSKWEQVPFHPGWSRIKDATAPDGYRYRLSPSAMRIAVETKLLNGAACGICGQPFTDVRDVVPDHIEPKGMQGGRRDDHPRNIQPAHSQCNLDKGSKRL